MAKRSGSNDKVIIESRPKKTRQGSSNHTDYSALSRNSKGKRYRGQGR